MNQKFASLAFLMGLLFSYRIALASTIYDQTDDSSSYIVNRSEPNSFFEFQNLPNDLDITTITLKLQWYTDCDPDPVTKSFVWTRNITLSKNHGLNYVGEAPVVITNLTDPGLVTLDYSKYHLKASDLNGARLEFSNDTFNNNYSEYGLWACYSNHWNIRLFGSTSPSNYITTWNNNDSITPYVTFNVVPPPLPLVYKTPVLIVPGILGTEIKQNDNFLWVNTNSFNPFNDDSFMDPMAFESSGKASDSSAMIGNVIRKIDPLGRFKKFDYTDGLINLLTSLGVGYTEGKDLFTFPYDWRYGVSGKLADGTTIVDQLKGQINYILTQTDAGKVAGKVDIIAHSTGGLLVKKYVYDNLDHHHIGKVIFVGVPSLGSPQAYKVLMMGDNFGVTGLSSKEMKKISQNMPVLYDLSPSQAYYNISTSSLEKEKLSIFHSQTTRADLNFNEAQDYLVKNYSANNTGFLSANQLHEQLDGFDLKSHNVDLYNLVGCKSWTLGKVKESTFMGDVTFYGEGVTGDGTVPMVSATGASATDDHTFYFPGQEHGQLLSANNVRQQIVNLVSGSSLAVDQKAALSSKDLQSDSGKCELKGYLLKMLSPAYLEITDSSGNVSTMLDAEKVENDIPGANYQTFGEHKFVFLPTDNAQTYSIKLKGTGTGTFTLQNTFINDGRQEQTEVFANIPVTPALTGQVRLGSGGVPTTLTIITSPGSNPVSFSPSSFLTSLQSLDTAPPISTSTLTGVMGSRGFYKSDVTIGLSSQDEGVGGDSSQASGLLNIFYKLDDNATSTYQTPVIVNSEGKHFLTFFATDKAGNNERWQQVSFIIDKTPPEFVIQFSPTKKDLDFTGTDNISSSSVLTVLDQDDTVTLTDEAGNTTQLKLAGKNRKILMTGTIKALYYNGVAANISKNIMAFLWLFDKNKNLSLFSQAIRSQNGYSILAIYAMGKTTISGIDKNGKINKILPGVAILKIITNKGDLNWLLSG